MTANNNGSLGFEPFVKVCKASPLLSAEEEQHLAREARTGSDAGFERLVSAHLRLVLTIAHEFRKYGLALEELVSEGMLGLVEAARRFDPEKGVRLAAYAAWWIRAYIRRYTLSNRRIVRMPSSRHGRKLLANLRRFQQELTQATGQHPDAQTVATLLGVDVRDVEEVEAALSGRDISCSLDANGGPQDLADAPSPEAIMAAAEERQRSVHAIRSAMSKLSDRERRILHERHLTEDTTTLASIGRELGLSRERVRQIEHQARSKVQRALEASASM